MKAVAMVLAEPNLAPNLVASIKAITFDEGTCYFSNLNLGLDSKNKPIHNNIIVVQTKARKEYFERINNNKQGDINNISKNTSAIAFDTTISLSAVNENAYADFIDKPLKIWLAVIYTDNGAECIKATILEYREALPNNITNFATAVQCLNGFAQRANEAVASAVLTNNGGYCIENTQLAIL